MKFDALRRGACGAAAFLLGATLGMSGCSLDEVKTPELSGPAELGLALKVQAIPDALTADGYSTSSITVTAFDNNGQRAGGITILFDLSDESGNRADIGTLETSTGSRLHAATATAVTGSDGVAQVIYRAPARTDLTGDTNVVVTVRRVGDDFNGQTDRFVRIELKSAEPRLFPQVPGNVLPSCLFVMEPNVGPFLVGQVILFQSTASDADGTIVRYEWDFGDGSKEDKPDVAHAYRIAGTYTVTHVCVDDDGGLGSAIATLPVTN